MHKGYIRIVPGSKTAVLFIHGIVGTPGHFTRLLSLVELVPESWSVQNLLLDGHGGSAQDFARTSMKKWEQQVENAFLSLAETHEKVLLVGHSMGSLFSLQLARRYPEKIGGLFLVACPLHPWVKLTAVEGCLRVALDLVRPDQPVFAAMRTACGTTPEKNLLKYIFWIPRMLELLVLAGKTGRQLESVSVPVTAYQSRKDELVSNRSGKALQRLPNKRIVVLENSTHFYYTPEERELIHQGFRELIEKQA